MNNLKEIYLRLGYKTEKLEISPWYLSELTIRGAIEIDNHILGKNADFKHVKEFYQILEKYQLKDTDNAFITQNFPYLSIWNVSKQNSDKEVRIFSELALEMRLLQSELKQVPTDLTKMAEIRDLLCNFQKNLIIKQTN